MHTEWTSSGLATTAVETLQYAQVADYINAVAHCVSVHQWSDQNIVRHSNLLNQHRIQFGQQKTHTAGTMVLNGPRISTHVRISTSTGPSSDTHGKSQQAMLGHVIVSQKCVATVGCSPSKFHIPPWPGWFFGPSTAASPVVGFQVPCIYMRYPANKHRNANEKNNNSWKPFYHFLHLVRHIVL